MNETKITNETQNAKQMNKVNSFGLTIAMAICLLFPAAAFPQTVQFLIDLAARRTQNRTSAIGNLNDETRKQIVAANKNRGENFQSVAEASNLTVSALGRGLPFINFEDGKTLAASNSENLANGKPVALAGADFDADGTPDLAVARAAANGGFVSIRRGNVESIFPSSGGAQAAPFFSETQDFETLLVPDFLAAGDFNADGRADLLAARTGASVLILLSGEGNGGFAAPQAIKLNGEVTAFATGEVNNFDNTPDVAVGIVEKGKAKILIFHSRNGAFAAEPEVLEVGKTVNALAFGDADARVSLDLAAAVGDELVLISGRARNVETAEIEPERVSRWKVDFQIASLAIGDFAGDENKEIALLSDDGEIFIAESQPLILAKNAEKTNQNQISVARENLRLNLNSGYARPQLIAAKISTRQKTDLIIGGASNLNLVTSDDANNLTLAAAFDTSDAPIAVLPMRLNKDALADLVILTEHNAAPLILMTAPTEVITVNNAGSGGGGGTTLSNAIQTANNTPGLQEIQFNISGNIPIQMQVALPAITDPIVLNGLSQSNQNGEPLVSISIDPNFPTDGPTLEIVGGSSVVRGLILNGAGIGNPIRLRTGGNNFVESNFIGTNSDGTEPGATTAPGVDISDSSANTIGGSTAPARNVISGVGGFGTADAHGVQIIGASSNNLIKGNYIGIAKTGLQTLGNGGSGVFIGTAASGNRVGGATDGERNVISGNLQSGVKIKLPTNSFSNALVENNFIGTNKNGDVALGNAASGVRLEYATGSSTPTAAAQVFDNVISGNTGDGIYAFNSGTSLELNAAPAFGVTPSGGEKKPTKVGTPNDVNAAPEAGVIFFVDIARRPPGNLNGAANANAVAAGTGNRIGTNAAGTAALANTGNGVRLNNFPSRIEGNVISANGISGIRSTGATPFGNLIADNYIGTNAAGTAALGNANKGIWMDSANFPTVETQTTKIYDNTISGNTGDGVFASVTTATNFTENNAAPEAGAVFFVDIARRPPTNLNGAANANAVAAGTGNRIGTNAAGTAALPNTGNGVNLQNATAKIEGSIISANGANGIKSNLQPSATRFSQIADNYIGTDTSGANDLGNTADGINLEFNGTAPTTVEASKIWNNVISGNNGDGLEVAAQNVSFSGFNSNAPQVGAIFLVDIAARRRSNFNANSPEIAPTGNRIGTNAAGTAAVRNNGNGILLTNAPALVEGNLISANGANGIRAKLPASSSVFNQIADNYIGTDLNGNVDLGNTADGITFEVPTNGTRPATSRIWSNVVSGNNGDGVRVFRNANFTENAVPAFGVPPSGGEKKLTKVGTPNNENAAPQVAALFVVDMAARRPGNLNVAPGDAPAGNKIGTNAAGTAALGNSGNGVSITNVTTNIGGANPADGNIIAHNGAKGIVIFSGTGNLIESNAIFSNAILNIDLGGDGLTPNDLGDTDTGANNLQNYPVLTSASSGGAGTTVSGAINTTPNTALTIQFFASTGGAMITGGNPLGTFAVTSNASGNASFSATFPVGTPAGRFVSATARTNDTNVGNENNTSEISPGVAVLGPTAASVSVAGRVLYANGRGVARAIVSLTNTSGATRTAMTNSFGYYRFADVAAGETYVFNVTAKRLSFAPLALNLTEEIESLNFTAQFSQKRLR